MKVDKTQAPVMGGMSLDDADIDNTDRQIINCLQQGFPLTPRPYFDVARMLGIEEDELIYRIEELLNSGVLTRFGPLFQVDNMGGRFSLAAMKVPQEMFEVVAGLLNEMPQIAHNYQREHEFNMWFVIATETVEEVDEVIRTIEKNSALKVYNMPKQQEFFVKLKLTV